RFSCSILCLILYKNSLPSRQSGECRRTRGTFSFQNMVELRDNNWVPRKAYVDNGPKTINQVRQDAVKGQNSPVFSHKPNHSAQVQSKDVAPRFSKKGKLNADEAFLRILDQCPKIEEEIPLVKSYLAQFAARAILAELVGIDDLAHQLENGAHFPLFLLCLQQMVKLKDRDWLADLFQQSKLNMQKMLPEKLNLMGFPFSYSLLQYIAYEINPDDDEEQLAAPSKEQLDEEKQLLLSFKPVLQKFLHDHINLQVSALYALQVHCNTKSFPKGMLLRYFVNLYDMEIVEEEAFLSWKEDVTEEYPGKGKALFQILCLMQQRGKQLATHRPIPTGSFCSRCPTVQSQTAAAPSSSLQDGRCQIRRLTQQSVEGCLPHCQNDSSHRLSHCRTLCASCDRLRLQILSRCLGFCWIEI
ncbi:hypothetical protein XENOCAPTIV_011608, partial [Xenoophorus captivus]